MSPCKQPSAALAIGPNAPPPADYAPLPEDYPSPALPNVSVCPNLGRCITVTGCI